MSPNPTMVALWRRNLVLSTRSTSKRAEDRSPTPRLSSKTTKLGPSFFMLFPYGTGHWQGLDGHPTRLTFDEYAQYRLQVHNSPFKRSVNWLLWALTMVKEEKSRWMLSYALWAGCDQITARHIGKGLIQLKTNYRVNWEPVRRVGDVLELK